MTQALSLEIPESRLFRHTVLAPNATFEMSETIPTNGHNVVELSMKKNKEAVILPTVANAIIKNFRIVSSSAPLLILIITRAKTMRVRLET